VLSAGRANVEKLEAEIDSRSMVGFASIDVELLDEVSPRTVDTVWDKVRATYREGDHNAPVYLRLSPERRGRLENVSPGRRARLTPT